MIHGECFQCRRAFDGSGEDVCCDDRNVNVAGSVGIVHINGQCFRCCKHKPRDVVMRDRCIALVRKQGEKSAGIISVNATVAALEALR